MGIFRKRKETIDGLLGVDIGAGGMKIVELRKSDKKLKLGTYGFANFNADLTREMVFQQPKMGAKLLVDMIKKAGVKVKTANVSLPSYEVSHAIVTIPSNLTDKDLIQAQVRAQAAKVLDRPLEEMVLDTTFIDKPVAKKQKESLTADEVVAKTIEKEKPASYRRVLISAAPKHLVQGYASLFSIAGLKLLSLETEAFALIRSLVGKDKARVMVIDMGYAHTSVTIVQDGIPFLHRSIEVGGNTVTQQIAKSMEVDWSEAEQMKKDLSTGPKATVPKVLQDAFKPILHEIRFTLQLYDQQDFHAYNTVDKIILTGGSSHLPYLDPFLSDALNINIYLGNPWARVVTPSKLQPALDEIGPRMSIAIGLAMKQKL